MKHVRQPEGSSLCGQACIAMAADVSLDRAVEAVGHSKPRGTYTSEVIAALRLLGVGCADRLRRVSRQKPVLPARAMLHINNDGGRSHWMLTWDGVIYDPEDRWPDYTGWRITSYLEIH
jgi:hypothetical protein